MAGEEPRVGKRTNVKRDSLGEYVECINRGCEEAVSEERLALGYETCISCGSPEPKRTIAIPYNKGAYQLITRDGLEDLKSVK